MQTQTRNQRGKVPIWLAALLLLLAVGGAAWYVWHNTRPKIGQIASDIPDGLMYGRGGMYMKSGDDELVWSGGNVWLYHKLQDAERAALYLIRDMGLAATVSLTQQQRAELQKIIFDAQLSAEQKKTLQTIFSELLRSRGSDAQDKVGEKLKAALNDIGKAVAKEAEAAAAARQKQLATILQPEQIAKAQQYVMDGIKGEWGFMPAPPPQPDYRTIRRGGGGRDDRGFIDNLRDWAARPNTRPAAPANPPNQLKPKDPIKN